VPFICAQYNVTNLLCATGALVWTVMIVSRHRAVSAVYSVACIRLTHRVATAGQFRRNC